MQLIAEQLAQIEERRQAALARRDAKAYAKTLASALEESQVPSRKWL